MKSIEDDKLVSITSASNHQ